MEQGRLIQQAGFMYETEGFKQRNLFRAPPRAARRHGTLLLPLQRFPGYFAEEGAAFWTDIVYLEPIGQLLQLLRNLGGLLRPEVDADDGRADGYQQADGKPRCAPFPRESDEHADDARYGEGQGLEQTRLKLVGRLYAYLLADIIIVYRLQRGEFLAVVVRRVEQVFQFDFVRVAEADAVARRDAFPDDLHVVHKRPVRRTEVFERISPVILPHEAGVVPAHLGMVGYEVVVRCFSYRNLHTLCLFFVFLFSKFSFERLFELFQRVFRYGQLAGFPFVGQEEKFLLRKVDLQDMILVDDMAFPDARQHRIDADQLAGK